MHNSFSGLSIIIPFYNDPDCLNACLDSIVTATSELTPDELSRVEVIVVDDASPHPFIINDLPFKTAYHRLQANVGAGKARNIGASLANHTHFLFLDSDIVLDKHYLKIVFETLSKRHIKVYQGKISSVPANKNPSLFNFYLAISWHFFQTAYWWYGGWVLCAVIERSFFLQTGRFCEHYTGSGGEDFDFAVRLWATDSKAVVFDKRLVFYHFYDDMTGRFKKVFNRSPRLGQTMMKHPGIPIKFKIQIGLRALFSVLLTMVMLSAVYCPSRAVALYFLVGSLFFLTDCHFSIHLYRHHSWRLAVTSVFFRQMEYLAVLAGIIWGRVIKRHAF